MKKARRFATRRSPSMARAGQSLAGLVLVAALGVPTAATAAAMPAISQTPGPASPVQAPPEITNQKPHNGVITPPAGISRMPVIKPKVPTNMPVIPPAGTPGGNQKVVPK